MCIIKMSLAYWRMTAASGVPLASVIKSGLTAVNVAFPIRFQQSKQLKTLLCEFIALNK